MNQLYGDYCWILSDKSPWIFNTFDIITYCFCYRHDINLQVIFLSQLPHEVRLFFFFISHFSSHLIHGLLAEIRQWYTNFFLLYSWQQDPVFFFFGVAWLTWTWKFQSVLGFFYLLELSLSCVDITWLHFRTQVICTVPSDCFHYITPILVLFQCYLVTFPNYVGYHLFSTQRQNIYCFPECRQFFHFVMVVFIHFFWKWKY